MAGLGRLKRICKDALRLAGAVQETSPSDMRSGRCFPEKGCILERHIVRFTKMILLARASTAPSTCNFCRLSRRIARFNIFNLHFCQEVPYICFIFYSFNFHFCRKSRRIASVLHLQLEILQESHRRVSFLHLQLEDKIDEIDEIDG